MHSYNDGIPIGGIDRARVTMTQPLTRMSCTLTVATEVLVLLHPSAAHAEDGEGDACGEARARRWPDVVRWLLQAPTDEQRGAATARVEATISPSQHLDCETRNF